jgi:hypothetical protein
MYTFQDEDIQKYSAMAAIKLIKDPLIKHIMFGFVIWERQVSHLRHIDLRYCVVLVTTVQTLPLYGLYLGPKYTKSYSPPLIMLKSPRTGDRFFLTYILRQKVIP